MSIITKSSISGASANNFVLSVGTSGDTTYVLDKTYPSGSYDVSAISDSTYDIYAIALDGTSAGYTNTTKLTVSTNFKEVVILGASANEIFTFEYLGKVTSPTSSGDVASAGAFITSIDISSLPNIDDSTTVTGGNFAADVEAYFIDQSDNEVAAKTVVRNSSTEIVITRPDSFSTADSPFTIKVVNPGVTLPTGTSAHLLSNAVTAGTNPVWQTAASQSFTQDEAVSLTLVASDTESSDVDYAITAGSLPTGLSLDGETGVISGTPTVAETSVFTVRATDAGGNFVDREFTFEVAAAIFDVEYLVIAGGGGGGRQAAGGGGAGGYITDVFTTQKETSHSLTVGAGGPGQVSGVPPSTGNGSDSSAFGFTSIGGGGGAGYNNNNNSDKVGANGGSGGGTWSNNSTSSGTSGQGFGGAAGTSNGNYSETSGGGGGASAAGQSGNSSKSGDGGNGLSSSITGTAITRAGGGGGGAPSSGSAAAQNGTGGTGGGGNGGNNSSIEGEAGDVNTGGGGGGSGYTGSPGTIGNGGAGGSGVVILRYPAAYTIDIGAGLTGNTTTDGSDKVTEITAGTGNVSFS